MFKRLPLQLRFLLPLLAVLLIAAYVAQPIMDQLTFRWFVRDADARGALLANALSDSVVAAVGEPSRRRLENLFERTAQDERVFAIGLCDASDRLVEHTSGFPDDLSCRDAHDVSSRPSPRLDRGKSGLIVTEHPIAMLGGTTGDSVAGHLVLLHDLSFIDRRSQDTQRYMLTFLAGLGLVLAMLTMIVAQFSLRGWLRGARALLRGDFGPLEAAPAPELAPLAEDLRNRLREIEDEYRRIQAPEVAWTPDQLRELLHTHLRGDEIIVVSNREPYIHDHADERVVVKRPASGLVTAVEPVMRACSGTWIAHGSGTADREVVDGCDRTPVPPDAPTYSLRRIWLSPQEEQGYYYGFANQGLWPLCHVAHVRPVFRESDWRAYREVNRRFADAVVEEARTEDPIVLVQDYHLALAPKMIRERLPDATILTFWHIPWPNPESFGICPWRRELLEGLLGSSILGFHTRFHCKNFIETADRFLEARIEHEHSTVSVEGRETYVENYPISIAWPDAGVASTEECRAELIARHGLPPDALVGVGVDRFDYTKGIVERFNAVEHLLEEHPELIGRFVFLQVASPTRSALDEYRNFQQHVHGLVDRINAKYARDGYRPIHLLATHHEHADLNRLYRAAHVCVVTSLHDGMNLVCKEFVSVRDDEQGVLVLSRFAGAARELAEALLVNPYHVEETAHALHRAVTMSAGEQRERMISLRHTVRNRNVYRWAGRMLEDAARWRLRSRIAARILRHRRG